MRSVYATVGHYSHVQDQVLAARGSSALRFYFGMVRLISELYMMELCGVRLFLSCHMIELCGRNLDHFNPAASAELFQPVAAT